MANVSKDDAEVLWTVALDLLLHLGVEEHHADMAKKQYGLLPSHEWAPRQGWAVFAFVDGLQMPPLPVEVIFLPKSAVTARILLKVTCGEVMRDGKLSPLELKVYVHFDHEAKPPSTRVKVIVEWGQNEKVALPMAGEENWKKVGQAALRDTLSGVRGRAMQKLTEWDGGVLIKLNAAFVSGAQLAELKAELAAQQAAGTTAA